MYKDTLSVLCDLQNISSKTFHSGFIFCISQKVMNVLNIIQFLKW